MSASFVRATAQILPDRAVDNAAFAERLIAGSGEAAGEAERERVRSRAREFQRKTGLVERRFFPRDEDPVAVGTQLLEKLLQRSGTAVEDLDAVIVSSSSVHGFPGLSQQIVATLQRRGHNLREPFVLDIGSNACTGFLYALGLGDSLLRSGAHRSVAVLAIEFSSRCVAYRTDAFATSTLFGDAAAGVLMMGEGPGVASIRSVRMGSRVDAETIGLIHGGGLLACDLAAEVPDNARWAVNGPPVALGAMDIVTREVRRYQQAGVTVDWLIPHQANLTRILEPACERLGIPRERLCASFDRTGNTSSASIPLLLDDLLTGGSAWPGDNVVLVGFGASFAVGSAHLVVD